MDAARLRDTIQRICRPGRGILAADESSGSIKKRFDSVGVEDSAENRRSYRNMLFSAEGIEECISGVILYDETVDQRDDSGLPFPELLARRGIVPGIKVDTGKADHPEHQPQTLTHGLEGLSKRLEAYTKRSNGTLGFTKWRQVILVEPDPAQAFLDEAMESLAEYARICQEQGYVPITEPEVLMEGTHTLAQCKEVTERTLQTLYKKLEEGGVDPAFTILKPNMVLSGKDHKKDTPEEVADATTEVFSSALPKTLPGVVFLSGGQTPEQATENLNAVIVKAKTVHAPWWISFSYGRALQDHALKAWAGKSANIPKAQEAFQKRARLNAAAQRGAYVPEMESQALAA